MVPTWPNLEVSVAPRHRYVTFFQSCAHCPGFVRVSRRRRLPTGAHSDYALLRRRPRIRIGSVLTDLPTRLFTAHEIAFREYNTLLSHLLVDGFRRVPSSSK